jgi:hypothetical protein
MSFWLQRKFTEIQVNPLARRFINKGKIINLFVTYFCSTLAVWKILLKKAQKVLFSIKSRVASLGNIPIKVSNNLFDKLVGSTSVNL